MKVDNNMKPDTEPRVGEGLALLDFTSRTDGDKLVISYQKTSDYYLELFLWAILSFPFLLVVVGFLSQIASGSVSRLYYGLLTIFSLLIAISFLSKALMLLRDGHRVLVFATNEGIVYLTRCSLSKLLGKSGSYLFADAAGIRLNNFEFRRFFFRGLESGYEINLIMQDSSVVTVFPVIKSLQEATDVARQLAQFTRIPQL